MRARLTKHRRANRGTATVLLLFAACSTEDSVIELGRIEFYNDPARIEAPASAAVGEPFVVRVISYGGGCISFERTDVELTNDGADFLPFDRRRIPGKNEGCTADLRLYSHEATLAFETAGSKTIRIHGRRVSFEVDDAIQIPVTVVVE